MIIIGENKYLSIEDYAKRESVTVQTVYNHIKDKKVKTRKLLGKQIIQIK